MLASYPVLTLNQKKADLGIPRDSLKSHPALFAALHYRERRSKPSVAALSALGRGRQAFKTLKNDLSIRPIDRQLETRIEAHI
jgi:hypothetical protein